MGDDTPKRRADMPSKKSKTAPITIHAKASLGSKYKAQVMAMQPERRLQQVMVLGICFLMLMGCVLAVLGDEWRGDGRGHLSMLPPVSWRDCREGCQYGR